MEQPDEMTALMREFFGDSFKMQRSISVLCENNLKQNTDTVTPTILTMLTCPVQIQLTAIGWQPFKSKDLTYPYNQMTQEQKQVFRAAISGDKAQAQFHKHWSIFEHAMVHRRKPGETPILLKSLDVLGALCSLVLCSQTYQDKRLRVAVCNILLQRVQASVPLDKHTQSLLNERLFPLSAPVTPEDRQPLQEGAADNPPMK